MLEQWQARAHVDLLKLAGPELPVLTVSRLGPTCWIAGGWLRLPASKLLTAKISPPLLCDAVCTFENEPQAGRTNV
jgi:hypothetical protein